MLRQMLIGLSQNDVMRRWVTGFGPLRRAARRFVAGETLDEAVSVVKGLNAAGIKGILNEVGEGVDTPEAATAATRSFIAALDRIVAEKLAATISVKPSHLGLGLGQDFYYENVADLAAAARERGILLEIDMEGSADVAATLAVYERLLDTFGGGIRQAMQSYLHRTPADLARLVARGGNIRLVKGAYHEPARLALQGRQEIIAATRQQMALFLTPQAREAGAYLALGSHDPALIDWLLRETTRLEIGPDQFEIQMLQGVRRAEQRRLAGLGYQVRIYVPYGRAWYPYFMRRLAERPANLLFIARAFFSE